MGGLFRGLGRALTGLGLHRFERLRRGAELRQLLGGFTELGKRFGSRFIAEPLLVAGSPFHRLPCFGDILVDPLLLCGGLLHGLLTLFGRRWLLARRLIGRAR